MVVLVALLAIVLVVTGGVALVIEGAPTPPPSGPTAPPTQPGPAGPEGFPSNASNLRVISVSDALMWAATGRVDGRAMAVGGWLVTDLPMSCPWPGRDPLPIEGYCTGDHLSSAPYDPYTCTSHPDGSGSCHGNPVPPGVQLISALMLEGTAGVDALGAVRDARFKTGIPVVLVVHVGDLRSRQCPVAMEEVCAERAIVDRVAWVAGEDVESGAGTDLVTAMTADEAVFASRFEGALLTAFPVRLGDAWQMDPRFHGIGDDPVWVVRGIPLEPSGEPENPSRAVDVRLVDDATGNVLFAGPLAPGTDYVPARLLVQATEPMGGARGNTGLFYRVENSDGEGLVEGRLGSTMPNVNDTTINSAAAPVLVDAGSYLVRVWRALVPGDGHAHFNECTHQVSVDASAELVVEAAFPDQVDCQFVPQTFVGPFSQ